jgi:flagellar biosynthesis/type III secretory pathway ATPase
VLATYEQKDLILLGAYQRGTDRKVDFAIDNIDSVQTFLKQGTHEKTDFRKRSLDEQIVSAT